MVDKAGFLAPYKLQYSSALDSQCNRTIALDLFHEVVHAEGDNFTQNIGIIGAGCSVATLPIAEISHYYNIPMISWASAAAELSDRVKYRNYFRPVPSEEIYSPGLAALLDHYKWRQVAMMTQTESLFLNGQKVVTALLPKVDIVIRHFGTLDNPLKVDDLYVETQDMRVFVLNMYVNHAKTILCDAFQREYYYPRYLWITPGWYGNEWWTKALPENCTVEEIETVLGYSLSAVQYPLFNESEIADVGFSYLTFLQWYGQQLYIEALRGNRYTPDLTAPLAVDAVWSLALALNLTQDKIERGDEGGCEGVKGDLVPLEYFNYTNQKLGCLLQESMDEIKFLGISGIVDYDETGDRIGNTVRIAQYQPVIGTDGNVTLKSQLIAYALFKGEASNATNLQLEFRTELPDSVWPEGQTPDGIPNENIVTTALALTVLYYILASVGIGFALVCLGFNIIFRRRKIVRLTSPNLNYLIIAGAILLYMSVFFWVSPVEEEMKATIICNFRVWLFSIGNTLCLAVVLSKMWRVHYIFTAPSPKRKPKPPQDWHLLIIVSVLVSVDFIILLVPTALESARLHGQLTDSEEHTATEDKLGVRQIHSYYSCYSDSQLIWLFMSYIYKVLLQIAAIYFAFMSRKVKVKVLNDSKQIAAIIYITSLLLVISVFGFWIGLLYLNTSTAIFSAAQLLTATVILGLLFIPKMISLKLDPKGEKIFTSGNNNTTASFGTDIMDSSQAAKLQELTVRVKELESELERYQFSQGLDNGSGSVTGSYTIKTATPTQTSPDTKLETDTECKENI
jgi:gamma-aminobutyric acid type B receptor